MRTMLKSKIHRATVTEANVEYRGSITLDPLLMAAADILPFEAVHVLDITNGGLVQVDERNQITAVAAELPIGVS